MASQDGNGIDAACENTTNIGNGIVGDILYPFGFILLPCFPNWPRERRTIFGFLLFLLLIGIIVALALIPVYISASKSNDKTDITNITLTINIINFCYVPIKNDTNGNLLLNALLNNKLIVDGTNFNIADSLSKLYADFLYQILKNFTNSVNTNIRTLDLTKINDQHIIKPTFDSFSKITNNGLVINNLSSNLNNKNALQVYFSANRSDLAKYIDLLQVNNCTQGLANLTICEQYLNKTDCLNIICKIDEQSCKPIDIITTTKAFMSTSSTASVITSKSATYAKTGSLVFDKFCRIQIRNDNNGEELKKQLEINKTGSNLILLDVNSPQTTFKFYDSLNKIYQEIFIKMLGVFFESVNLTYIQLETNGRDSFIRPYLNLSYKIENSNTSTANVTSKLNVSQIESEFNKNLLSSQSFGYLLNGSISGCNGSVILINECNSTDKNSCKNQTCIINVTCDKNSGDDEEGLSTRKTTITGTSFLSSTTRTILNQSTSTLNPNIILYTYGYIFIDKFCRIEIKSDINGDQLKNALEKNLSASAFFLPIVGTSGLFNFYASLTLIYEKIFSNLFGSFYEKVNLTYVELEAGTEAYFIRPYLNISYKIQNFNINVRNLTSRLNYTIIQSEFSKYLLENSDLNKYILSGSIDKCNGTIINIVDCNKTEIGDRCKNDKCILDVTCDKNSGDDDDTKITTTRPITSTSITTTSQTNRTTTTNQITSTQIFTTITTNQITSTQIFTTTTNRFSSSSQTPITSSNIIKPTSLEFNITERPSLPTSVFTSASSTLKPINGYFLVENLCKVRILDTLDGSYLKNALLSNRTVISEKNFLIYNTLQNIYEKIFTNFFGSKFDQTRILFVGIHIESIFSYMLTKVNVSFKIQSLDEKRVIFDNITLLLIYNYFENYAIDFKQYLNFSEYFCDDILKGDVCTEIDGCLEICLPGGCISSTRSTFSTLNQNTTISSRLPSPSSSSLFTSQSTSPSSSSSSSFSTTSLPLTSSSRLPSPSSSSSSSFSLTSSLPITSSSRLPSPSSSSSSSLPLTSSSRLPSSSSQTIETSTSIIITSSNRPIESSTSVTFTGPGSTSSIITNSTQTTSKNDIPVSVTVTVIPVSSTSVTTTIPLVTTSPNRPTPITVDDIGSFFIVQDFLILTMCKNENNTGLINELNSSSFVFANSTNITTSNYFYLIDRIYYHLLCLIFNIAELDDIYFKKIDGNDTCINVGISIYFKTKNISNFSNPEVIQLLVASNFMSLNINFLAQNMKEKLILNPNGIINQSLCYSNEITNKLQGCEICLSRLKDTVLNCSDAFKDASWKNTISNNLASLINNLRLNLNITDINDLLSSPIANKTEYKVTITNYTVVRSNDPNITLNSRLKRSNTVILNPSLQNIYSKINLGLKANLGNILESVTEITFAKKGMSSKFPQFTEYYMSSTFNIIKTNGPHDDINLLILQSLISIAITRTNFTDIFLNTPFVFEEISNKSVKFDWFLCFNSSITKNSFCRSCNSSTLNDTFNCYNDETGIKKARHYIILKDAVSFISNSTELSLSNTNDFILPQNLRTYDLLLRSYLQTQLSRELKRVLQEKNPIFVTIDFYKYDFNKNLTWVNIYIEMNNNNVSNAYITQALFDQVINTIDFQSFYWPNAKLIKSENISIIQKLCSSSACDYCASTIGNFSKTNCSCSLPIESKRINTESFYNEEKEESLIDGTNLINEGTTKITTQIPLPEIKTDLINEQITSSKNPSTTSTTNLDVTDLGGDPMAQTSSKKSETSTVKDFENTDREIISSLNTIKQSSSKNPSTTSTTNLDVTDLGGDPMAQTSSKKSETSTVKDFENTDREIISSLNTTKQSLDITDNRISFESTSTTKSIAEITGLTTPNRELSSLTKNKIEVTEFSLESSKTTKSDISDSIRTNSILEITENEITGNNPSKTSTKANIPTISKSVSNSNLDFTFDDLKTTLDKSSMPIDDVNSMTTKKTSSSNNMRLTFNFENTQADILDSTENVDITKLITTKQTTVTNTKPLFVDQSPADNFSNKILTTDYDYFTYTDIVTFFVDTTEYSTSQLLFNYTNSTASMTSTKLLSSIPFITTSIVSRPTQPAGPICKQYSNQTINITLYDIMLINFDNLSNDKIVESLNNFQIKLYNFFDNTIGIVAKRINFLEIFNSIDNKRVRTTLKFYISPIVETASYSLQLLVIHTIKNFNLTQALQSTNYSVSYNSSSVVEQTFCDSRRVCIECRSIFSKYDFVC